MKRISRLLLSVLLASIPQAAIAAPPPIALENGLLHLQSCLMPSAGWVDTTSVQISGEQGMAVYQAGYRPMDGSGSLKKRPAGRQTEAEWDAGVMLAGRFDARKLWTASDGDGSFDGIPFAWASLDAGQKQALNRSPVDGNDDGLGQKRLDYLRGVRTGEATLFRTRQRLLGPIVHGVPAFSGSSAAATEDGRSHGDANPERPEVVYVGAGDGMLHAFDAKTGEELFAYLPRAVFDRLPLLTTVGSTEVLPIDGGIAISNISTDSAGDRSRSILVAGMGRGAQGVLALDVTMPTDFNGDDVLWEFTDADDADIGNVIGTPLIAKFSTGLVRSVQQYRYFAVVPGGINNHVADGDGRFNPAGKAAVFLLALDKPAAEPWQAGINYFKFVLPASDANRANGIVELALVTAADGSASVAYAGDLLGNLWRLDFGGSTPDSHVPQLLFVARDADGNRQPITQRPRIVFAPERGYMVLFGTGKYLEKRDLDRGAYASQSFYGIWDRDGARIDGRSALVARIAQPQGDKYTIVGEALTYVPAGKRGWYLDFPRARLTGERSITSAAMLDTQVAFSTLLPAAAACAAPFGRTYLLDALTGLPVSAHFDAYLSEASFPGIPPPFFVMPVETGERDATGKRRVVRRLKRTDTKAGETNPDASSGATSDETIVETVTTAGRLSWREIIDWQELCNDR